MGAAPKLLNPNRSSRAASGSTDSQSMDNPSGNMLSDFSGMNTVISCVRSRFARLCSCVFEHLDSVVEPLDRHTHTPDEFDEAFLHDGGDAHDVRQLAPQRHSRLSMGIVCDL